MSGTEQFGLAMMESGRREGFTQGVVYSIAQVIRIGSNDGDAETLWNESGFSPSDVKVCDEYDVKELRKSFLPNLPKGVD